MMHYELWNRFICTCAVSNNKRKCIFFICGTNQFQPNQFKLTIWWDHLTLYDNWNEYATTCNCRWPFTMAWLTIKWLGSCTDFFFVQVNMSEKDFQRKKNKFLPKIHAWYCFSKTFSKVLVFVIQVTKT